MEKDKQKEKVPSSLLTLTAGVVITLVSLWYGQNHGLMPEQVSKQAVLIDNFFDIMMTIGTALFLVVEGAILIAVIRFRHRKGDDTDAVPIKGNLPLEAFWTAIPAILVIGLGIYSVQVYEDMGGFEVSGHHMMAAGDRSADGPKNRAIAAPIAADTEGMIAEATGLRAELRYKTESEYGFGASPERAGKAADVVVNVTGMQFSWEFEYEDTEVDSADKLHVPLGKDILLNISAGDVIHSFWIPQLRLKQDAIPGSDAQLRFVATKTGTYPIVCAELCGSYHGMMRTEMVVETEEEYLDWLAEESIALQQDSLQTVAVNPADATPSEFLAPYAEEMGIDANIRAQIHQHNS
ncbi:MAG: cytochrome c oxidase subunit II [Hormoscilla sp. GM102CHS1]|nr:cytochrome c oxidase subunit II [Hormoscilla sp. GM102CHS1]